MNFTIGLINLNVTNSSALDYKMNIFYHNLDGGGSELSIVAIVAFYAIIPIIIFCICCVCFRREELKEGITEAKRNQDLINGTEMNMVVGAERSLSFR
jgi:hypothetical protein